MIARAMQRRHTGNSEPRVRIAGKIESIDAHIKEYNFDPHERKLFDKAIRVRAIIEKYKEIYKTLANQVGNPTTHAEKLERAAKELQNEVAIADDPKFPAVFQKVAAVREKKVRLDDEGYVVEGQDEAAHNIAAEFDTLEILYDYKRDEVLKEVVGGILEISKQFRLFAEKYRRTKDQVDAKHAEEFRKIAYLMSRANLEIIEPDITDKRDLEEIAYSASSYPAVAIIGRATTQEIAKLVGRLDTKEKLEIFSDAAQNMSSEDITLAKLEKILDNIERISLKSTLVSEIKESLKTVAQVSKKLVPWLIQQVADNPEAVEYYLKAAPTVPNRSKEAFALFLQCCTKDDGEEVVITRINDLEAKGKITDQIRGKIVLALAQLVKEGNWTKVAQLIEEDRINEVEPAIDLILEGKINEGSERIGSIQARNSGIQDVAKQPETKTEETEKPHEITFTRIILISDSIYGRTIAERLGEISNKEVVLIDNPRVSRDYVNSKVAPGDVVVVDTSHISHAKSGNAIAVVRARNIPYVMGSTTNAERIVGKIKKAA